MRLWQPVANADVQRHVQLGRVERLWRVLWRRRVHAGRDAGRRLRRVLTAGVFGQLRLERVLVALGQRVQLQRRDELAVLHGRLMYVGLVLAVLLVSLPVLSLSEHLTA